MVAGGDAALERTCGRLLVGGFAGTELPRQYAVALREGRRAGAILFRRNLSHLEQSAHLCEQITVAGAGRPTIVAVDEEGGRVRRLPSPALGLPAMREVAAKLTPLEAGRAAEWLGRQLRALGFNLDFAPVLDVDSNPDNPVIGDRAFGRDPATVIGYGRAVATGLARAGVVPCGKHFPGHGDTDLDSHRALPHVRHALARLVEVELAPFAQLAGALPSLMTAHVLFGALDSEAPATLSRAVCTGLLREKLGYKGLVFSDDLEMHALDRFGSIEETSVRAVLAGCDVLLVCSDWALQERAHKALVAEAHSSLTFRRHCERSAARSERLLAGLGRPAPRNELSATLAALHRAARAEPFWPLLS